MCEGKVFLICIFFYLCQVFILHPIAETMKMGNGNIAYEASTDIAASENNDSCYEWNSCDYSRSMYIPNCYCDELCHVYDDCCIDHQRRSHDEIPGHHGHDMDTKRSDVQVFDLQCKVLYARDVGVHLVTTCLKEENSKGNVSEVSLKDRFLREVIVTGEDGVSYENENIASCNNVTNFKYWKINFALNFCWEGVDFGYVLNESHFDIALYYFELGCEFRLIPPEEILPRYCIFFGNHNILCDKRRSPVNTAEETFLNKECCRQYLERERCNTCHKSGYSTYDQLSARSGNSMAVLFHFPSGAETQEDEGDGAQYLSSVRIENAMFRQSCVVSTEGNIQDLSWLRAFEFYKLSIENALTTYKCSLHYLYRFFLEKQSNSNKGKIHGKTYLQCQNDLKSHRSYLEMKSWLLEREVIYYESVQETLVFKFSSVIIGNANNNCNLPNYECENLAGYVEGFHDPYDISSKIKSSKQFPNRNCKCVLGIVTLNENISTLEIQCADFPSNGTHSVSPPSFLRYILLCLNVVSLVDVVRHHLHCYLHRTVLAISFNFLLGILSLNEAVISFSHEFAMLYICKWINLISGTLLLMSLSTAVSGAIFIVYTMLRIQDTENDMILKCKLSHFFVLGFFILVPIPVAFIIYDLGFYQVYNGYSYKSYCDFIFMGDEIFVYAILFSDILLVALLFASFIVYAYKRNDIYLLKPSLRYVILYTILSILVAVQFVTLYFFNESSFVTWVLFACNGLAIPLIVPFYYVPQFNVQN